MSAYNADALTEITEMLSDSKRVMIFLMSQDLEDECSWGKSRSATLWATTRRVDTTPAKIPGYPDEIPCQCSQYHISLRWSHSDNRMKLSDNDIM